MAACSLPLLKIAKNRKQIISHVKYSMDFAKICVILMLLLSY